MISENAVLDLSVPTSERYQVRVNSNAITRESTSQATCWFPLPAFAETSFAGMTDENKL